VGAMQPQPGAVQDGVAVLLARIAGTS